MNVRLHLFAVLASSFFGCPLQAAAGTYFFNYPLEPFALVDNSRDPGYGTASFMYKSAQMGRGLRDAGSGVDALQVADENTYHGTVTDPSVTTFDLVSGAIVHRGPPGLDQTWLPPTRGGAFFSYLHEIEHFQAVLGALEAPDGARQYLQSVINELARTPGVSAVESHVADARRDRFTNYVAWGVPSSYQVRYLVQNDCDLLFESQLAPDASNPNGRPSLLTSQRVHLTAGRLVSTELTIALPARPADLGTKASDRLFITASIVPTGRGRGEAVARSVDDTVYAVQKVTADVATVGSGEPQEIAEWTQLIFVSNILLSQPRTLEVRLVNGRGEVVGTGRIDHAETTLAEQVSGRGAFVTVPFAFTAVHPAGKDYHVVVGVLPQGGRWDERLFESQVAAVVR